MKKILGLLCLILFVNKGNSQQVAELPYAMLENLQGRSVSTRSISDFDNPIIVMTYANSWCARCVKLIDDFDKEYIASGLASGVKLIAINVDQNNSVNDIKSKATRWKNVEVLIDVNGDFMNAMYSTTAPKIFFLDANQKVVYCHSNFNLKPDEAYKLARKIKQGQIRAQSVYFDSAWFPIEKTTASYYRNIEKQNNGMWTIRDFYINGQLQMSANSLIGCPEVYEGEVKYYNSKNKIAKLATYKKGKLEGIVKEWDDNGNLTGEFEYKNNMANGIIKTYYAGKGVLKERTKFEMGKRTGLWEVFYPNGTLKKKFSYLQDKLDGLSTIWNAEGKITFQAKFIYNEVDYKTQILWLAKTGESRLNVIEKDGVSTIEYKNDESLPIFKILKIKDESRFDLVTYSKGKINLQATMKDEKTVDGKYISWYNNGQKCYEITLWDNVPAGRAMAWYDNGNIRERIDFDNNVFEYFDESGNKIKTISKKLIALTPQSVLKTDHLKIVLESLDKELLKIIEEN